MNVWNPRIPAVGLLALFTCPALAGVGVSPAESIETLEPGDSVTITKTVTLPTVTPKLDLLLIVDLSGSYRNDLINIRSVASGLFDDIRADVVDSRFALASFKDFPFSGWGGSSDYAYRLNQDFTSSKSAWTTAISTMSASGGGDGPESQYEAVFQAVTGEGNDINGDGDYTDKGEIAVGQGVSFRSDATRVIAITTDAAFHNAGDGGGPFAYPGASKASVLAALSAGSIKVIAIKAPGATSQMNDLASASGGAAVASSSDSSNIVTAILTGLDAITFDVAANPTAECDPLEFSYTPDSFTGVANGGTVTFTEVITVPGSIGEDDLDEDGRIVCDVEFLADDAVIGTQTVTVTVPLNEPPVAVCADLELSAGSVCQADGSIDDGTFDPDGDEIDIEISPEGPYELGDTTVTLTVTDPSGESDACTAVVSVVDDTAPTMTVSGGLEMWPPNHKYRSFGLGDCGVTITDNCSTELDVDLDGVIGSIYSDEPEDATGGGDGSTTDDITIDGDADFSLRSERQGGSNGRVYGVSFDVADVSGNSAEGVCDVSVPHKVRSSAVNDGASAGYTVE